MSEPEKIEALEKRVAILEAERNELWAAIRNLRNNPAIDIPRMDQIMTGRYGVKPKIIRY